ncbi:MAG: hypothetical protein HFH85_05305 [Lachnospiraceae bacterium]|jgi:hypothetical protein|nr:hypothetical protein [Lachnospiraceae bacterium]
MRRVISKAVIVCMVFQLTACGFPFGNEKLLSDTLEEVAGFFGASQITGDENLIGERLYGRDAYTGRYLADCDKVTGRDVVFGGASVESRKLYLSGYIQAYSGTAVIRIRTNWEVVELEPDEDGYFETELNLESGGNYVIVKFEDFTGTVDLTSGYDRVSGLVQCPA